MKQPNELETQLRAWALRRPSAKLEARLFKSTPTLSEEEFDPTLRWGRLAPSAVGLVLVCFLLSQWNSPSFSHHTSSPLLPFASIEHSAANHIARVSGSRTFRTLDSLDMNSDSVTLAMTGTVSFPLLRATNH